MLDNFASIFFLFSFAFFCFKRGKLLMQFFQQEEYDNKRFFCHIFGNIRFIDKKLTIFVSLSFFIINAINLDLGAKLIIFAIIMQSFAASQINPCGKKAKKALLITPRVKRVLALYLIIFLLAIIAPYQKILNPSKIEFLIYIIAITQFIPIFLIIANLLLKPYENWVQNNFLKQANEKIKNLPVTTIGITGSYGKTSTKHILSHILSFVAPTLATPGSVNTPMGITRIIRENLKKEHKYFIAEMGAYGIGSIKRLCDLTNPDYGILTAVGDAHYERFKSIDNVAQAKFELNQAVSKKNGKTIINSDGVDDKFIKKYGQNIILVGQKNIDNNGYKILQIKQSDKGIYLKIQHKKKRYEINSPLFGIHHANNIAMSFAMAHNLGIDSDTIIAAQKTVPQIKHRLEIIKDKNSPIIIDDAYNSNPIGFAAALDILKILKKKNGKSILVTPGMVELGDLHNKKHKEVALIALKTVDVALIIMPQRVQSFVDTFKENMKKDQILLEFENFNQAKAWLDKNAKISDVILYENDLPDIYESKISL